MSDLTKPMEEPHQQRIRDSPEENDGSQVLGLPEPGTVEGKAQVLDVSKEGGSTVTLDHLGPLVVNVDGSMSRITNWDKMSEIEQKNTIRIISKRNQQRMKALQEQMDASGMQQRSWSGAPSLFGPRQ